MVLLSFSVKKTGYFTAMSFEGAYEWAKDEGFKNDLSGLLAFFETHYQPTEDMIFQSIAFPPKVV